MGRVELLAALMWNTGGSGYGAGGATMAALLEASRPAPKPEDDWRSVVAVNAPQEQYDDGELRELLKFSVEMTRRYDGMFKWRRGANVIIIGKEAGRGNWFRKRQSWEYGSMWSTNLEDALDIFRDKPKALWKRQVLNRLARGDEAAAFKIYYEKRRNDFDGGTPDESEIREEFEGRAPDVHTVAELRYTLDKAGWKDTGE